ncbi:M20/M25/M40 family metallo-hydrolase [Thermosulfurimonas marina]|uniref:M20/M25/M40 family metallo-hydrolase n=1 Tax=Thermosulfurimonas marina TaxID=2047767 RepID=A0A6H1WQZ4_9BACT|nr:M20/M25/M40 family metallo-hydrolase [Thermosulfurimonas marina]QJA05588.1 M20/M25/M40 family metallo-hydrolase [Thermosulfurimonas marina]
MLDPERLKLEFLTLAQIDSPSRKEKPLAQHLVALFEALGGECFFDHSAVYTESETGNLIVKLPGTAEAPPVLLSAHLDTIEPTPQVRPLEENGLLRNEKPGLIGADDKSGIAIIIEVVRALRESGLPYPPLELVFTTCEEIGLLGARYLDYKLLKARWGLVLDSEDPRRVVVRAPEAIKFQIRVLGRAAHAGLEPEKGLNAIKIAAEALSRLPSGRIDPETTLNFGTIKGGKATNIVPEEVVLEGEIRSHRLERLEELWERIAGVFAEVTREKGPDGRPEFEARREEMFPHFHVPEDHPLLGVLQEAGRRIGLELEFTKSEGGSDANLFNRHGVACVILGTGMRRVHSPEEYLLLEDFFLCARLVYEFLALVAQNPSAGR